MTPVDVGEPVPLFHAEELGPCFASVTVSAVRWRTGALRFQILESWRLTVIRAGLPEKRGFTTFDFLDEESAAIAEGRRRADQWSRGRERSDELAPGGSLPELRPS